MKFHRARTYFWAAQIPPAVWIGGWKPDWARWLMTYLVLISIAALVESAATDWDQARHALDQAGEKERSSESDQEV